MNTDAAVRAILSQLPKSLRRKLDLVRVEHRPAPTLEDLERGATKEHKGYFFGVELEHVKTTELPDEEPPRGVVVLFTGKIWPLDVEQIAKVLLHELAHALGYDHDVIEEEMGLC